MARRAAIQTLPYDRALTGSGEIDRRRQSGLRRACRSRGSREQQDDFYSVFSQNTGINLSGVEVGATVVGNLLEQRTLQPLPLPFHVALVALLGVAFGSVVGRLSMARAAGVAAGRRCALLQVAMWQFTSYEVWLPLVVPLLLQLPVALGVAIWWNYREVAVQRERVQTALGYYVPKSVARRLSDQALSVGSNRAAVARDVPRHRCGALHVGSETLSPVDLAALMNDYYRAIFRVVQLHGGEISDTAGDSMIAVWASVEPDARARLRAAQAALAILDAVEEFNRAHATRAVADEDRA